MLMAKTKSKDKGRRSRNQKQKGKKRIIRSTHTFSKPQQKITGGTFPSICKTHSAQPISLRTNTGKILLQKQISVPGRFPAEWMKIAKELSTTRHPEEEIT